MNFKNLPRGAGLAGALILLIVVATFTSPHFLNPTNLLNVFRQVAPYGILGVGMTFVILTRGINLSVGSAVAISGVCGALLMESGLSIPLMKLCCMLMGILVGAVNGLGIAVPIYIFVVVCIISAVVLGYTPFRRAIYALGSNEEAARLLPSMPFAGLLPPCLVSYSCRGSALETRTRAWVLNLKP